MLKKSARGLSTWREAVGLLSPVYILDCDLLLQNCRDLVGEVDYLLLQVRLPNWQTAAPIVLLRRADHDEERGRRLGVLVIVAVVALQFAGEHAALGRPCVPRFALRVLNAALDPTRLDANFDTVLDLQNE